ncbi:MAG: hypothetical protein ACI31R_02950 [Bacilli bacterium]
MNKGYFEEVLETTNYSHSTPINPLKIKDVACDNCVVLSEEVYNKLLELRNMTLTNDMEIPYLLYGKDKGDGIIYFNQISYDTKNLRSDSADFNPMTRVLERKVFEYTLPEYAHYGLFDKGPFERIYVCVGHSHGYGECSDCFSFNDLKVAVAFKDCADFFKSESIQILNMLLTPSGDFNFIKYESNPLFEGFYKYPTVFVRKKSAEYEKIPSYELGEYDYMDNLIKKK